jgi:branched-chain amino acid transport system permease protein
MGQTGAPNNKSQLCAPALRVTPARVGPAQAADPVADPAQQAADPSAPPLGAPPSNPRWARQDAPVVAPMPAAWSAGHALAMLGLSTAAALAASYMLSPVWLLELQHVAALALFAVATNLLVGYGGLVSFGQAAYYGLGAYTIALAWLHFKAPFWPAFIATPLVGALSAFMVGLVALRTRKLYFALLTLAFAQLFYTVAQQQYELTNGATGIFGVGVPAALMDPQIGFLFVFAAAALAMLALWKITVSPFGLTLRAIRENRARAQSLGIDVFRHELLAFVLAGAFSALAGGLFIVHDQSAYPELLDWTKSGEPIFMLVLGGMNSFLGPALGALVYQISHEVIVQHLRDWQLVLGLVVLAIVLFMPDGIVGLFSAERWRRWLARPRSVGGGET